jgi:hypothetical protein
MLRREGIPAPQYAALQAVQAYPEAGDEKYSTCRCMNRALSLQVRKKTDPLEKRLEKKLDGLVARLKGNSVSPP